MEEEIEKIMVFGLSGFERGLENRAKAHAQGLWHKAVHVWLFNEKKQLFLKKRAEWKELFPLHWEAVGEHLRPGETFKEAALRGLKEELGVDAEKIKRIDKVMETKMSYAGDKEFIELWFCFYDGKVKENEESEGGRFFSEKDVNQLIKNRELVSPSLKELFYWCRREKKWPKEKV